MGGKILEYEAKTIRNEGIRIGRDEGISIGRNEGINIGLDRGRDEERKRAMTEKEESAKAMLRDNMAFSQVERYTHLPMPRIQELARGLGML